MSKPTMEEMLIRLEEWVDGYETYRGWEPSDRAHYLAIRSLIKRSDAVERLVNAARDSIVWIENYPSRKAVKTALAALEKKGEAKENEPT